MLAVCQWTDSDHGGGVEEAVTEDHVGSPERLGTVNYVRFRSQWQSMFIHISKYI
jgi:hypothetical protein